MTGRIQIVLQPSSSSRPSSDLWMQQTNAHDDFERISSVALLEMPKIDSICEQNSQNTNRFAIKLE
eukprot:1868219-Pyramimonas_sp.AAC.1